MNKDKKNLESKLDSAKKIFNKSDRFIAFAMYGIALFLVVFSLILLADPAWLRTLNKVDKHHEVKKMVFLGKEYFDNKEYDKAAYVFGKALDIIPEMIEAKTLLAETYREAGNPAKAIEIYQDVLQTDSSHYHLFALHNLFLIRGDTVRSDEYFHRSLYANPLTIDRLMKLGKYYIVNKQWEEAAAAFDSVVSARYDMKIYYSDMIARTADNFDDDEKIAANSNSVFNAPVDNELMSIYSEIIFKKNLSRDISLAKTLNKVGTVAGTMGNTQKAIINFKAAVGIDPGYTTAKKNLKIALREAERSK